MADHADPLYRQCPHCGARWHRYSRLHWLGSAATPYVDGWPAHHLRSVEAAWSDGVVRLTVGGRPYEVRRPTAGADGIPAEPLVVDRPVYVLTAWNPGGRAATLTSNHARQTALEADPMRAIASAPQEDGVCVRWPVGERLDP